MYGVLKNPNLLQALNQSYIRLANISCSPVHKIEQESTSLLANVDCGSFLRYVMFPRLILFTGAPRVKDACAQHLGHEIIRTYR